MSELVRIPGNTLRLDIDADDATKALSGLNERAMEAAMRRAVRKTAIWVKNRTAREVSQATKIELNVLRSRLNLYNSKNSAKIWLGLNKFKAHHLGKLRQTQRGVSAGKVSFDGAFIRNINGNVLAFRRTGERRRMKKGNYAGQIREAIERVDYDWSEPGEAAFRAAAARADARLMEILQQEVNYELQKAAGNAR
jgi:hypothetical protein